MDSEFWQAEARFDWGEYVREQGGIRALHSRKDEYLLQCPDCGKVKLAVNVDHRAWQCFVCGDGGRDASSLVAKAEHLLWHEAIIQVMSGKRAAVGPIDRIMATLEPQNKQGPKIFKEVPYPDGFKLLRPWKMVDNSPNGWEYESWGLSIAGGWELAKAQEYCNRRGIAPDVVAEMRLGVCLSGKFRNRLIFPVYDAGNRLLFYQGRAMWTPNPMERHIKILSPAQERDADDNPITCGPNDVLLNLQYLLNRGGCQSILVVEGPIDLCHAWPDAVATFGKKISPKQLELLARAGIKRLDLCWDSDAMREMLKMAPGLTDLFEVRIVALPEGRDPGDFTKDELEVFRSKALRWSKGERLNRIITTIR